MTRRSVFTKSLLLSATLAGGLALSAAADGAFARDSDHKGSGDQHRGSNSSYDGDHHHHHHKKKPTVPVHGPGSSHNPIVYHPVHGPGSSHNPIIVSTSKYPPGTVVRDHRNGKNCQYTVGDPSSIRAYNRCEYGYGGRGGGH